MRKSISTKTVSAPVDQITEFANLMVAENAKHQTTEDDYTPAVDHVIDSMFHAGRILAETQVIGGHRCVTA